MGKNFVPEESLTRGWSFVSSGAITERSDSLSPLARLRPTTQTDWHQSCELPSWEYLSLVQAAVESFVRDFEYHKNRTSFRTLYAINRDV